MIAVCRPYDGITLNNEVEYVLDDNGEIKEFVDVDTAKRWLIENGINEEYMEILMFVNMENGKLIIED